MQSPGALQGIRILDFSRVLAGPFCTMLLADYGAEVVKIEQPGSGDETRQWGPPWVGDAAQQMSAYFVSVNRNKQSLTLNLKTREGQVLAHQLAAKADVLIENFKVGQMARYGLDYATLSAEYPGLIYCSITGYGQDGPYAERPGYDYAIQAQSGLMAITGPAESEPYKVGVAISDVVTGLFASNAILAALHHRQQTGQGQYIDIALLDSQIAALVNVASNYLITHQPPVRYGNSHPNIVPYQTFEASDGTFVLAVGNDGQFRLACQAIGKPEFFTDPRFASNPARVTHRDELVALLKPIFKQKTVKEWVECFVEAGVPVAPVNELPQVFDDPQVQARGLVHTSTLPDGTPVPMVGPAAQFSHTPPSVRSAPPLLGQHNAEVLREWLNFDDTTIKEHHRCGII